MDWASPARWLFDSQHGARDRLLPRWLFLRALALIYFSAFCSLAFQIRGLIGPQGILPAKDYLELVARSMGVMRYWFAPTLLWLSAGSHMVTAICWAGMLASILLFFNLWPRGMLFICLICYLSFVAAAQDFSGYQSDGMLLEAGFIALFFAPLGWRPRLAEAHPPTRASLFLLQYEWFRIYFESGMVKLASGDPQWRNFTAMDEYYQNGPLPTWVGWYVQHLPLWFHAGTVYATLALELGLVWMFLLPRRWRIVCFFIVTPWEIGVILTANYTFLNYLVLCLGVLLLDDRFCARFFPTGWRKESMPPPASEEDRSLFDSFKLAASSALLVWIFYVTTVEMLSIPIPSLPLPKAPIVVLEPFRVANQYGLFAVMTRNRYEIEFQGSNDGQNWTPYPFRYKPQDLNKAPGIYAPHQPRLDWNLWFASLGMWREYPIVPATEERLLENDPDVLALFKGNPFPQAPPKMIRVVLWQYWFTSMAEKRATGNWWRRDYLGLYGPTLTKLPDGRFGAVEWPTAGPRD